MSNTRPKDISNIRLIAWLQVIYRSARSLTLFGKMLWLPLAMTVTAIFWIFAYAFNALVWIPTALYSRLIVTGIQHLVCRDSWLREEAEEAGEAGEAGVSCLWAYFIIIPRDTLGCAWMPNHPYPVED